ncbi:hypothetical protein GALMADRAFT_234825 [Galerina marginata CBS 339.88]|uniref:2,5-diamino-6-ribosylamino-4(3H)-pyrimidinone 5'-phosphate reductase n=1 Tax=Galerina marginata (strain CBS 339.88) TaxID=685588 RepID=A0A067U0D8_GALM3|nr:hypothetical protein GALMADRAFT_234825 [Galerina marginata CBS 339.88]
MNSKPPHFLQAVLGRYANSLPFSRPHVTLTFAQSLDAKIAGEEGRQLILSGKESMVMTHWMRTMHDAILIGIGTALNDDPQLNVRHLPQPVSTSYHLPRPIIIDTHLRLSPTCKLLRNFQNGVGRRPWVLSISTETPLFRSGIVLDDAKLDRKRALEAAGARIVGIPPINDDSTRIFIPTALQTLRDLGIRSLMVEGGARIIASFLAEDAVDTLIITTAPVFVGNAGVGYSYPMVFSESGEIKNKFKEVHTELFGSDTVVSLVSEPLSKLP